MAAAELTQIAPAAAIKNIIAERHAQTGNHGDEKSGGGQISILMSGNLVVKKNGALKKLETFI